MALLLPSRGAAWMRSSFLEIDHQAMTIRAKSGFPATRFDITTPFSRIEQVIVEPDINDDHSVGLSLSDGSSLHLLTTNHSRQATIWASYLGRLIGRPVAEV